MMNRLAATSSLKPCNLSFSKRGFNTSSLYELSLIKTFIASLSGVPSFKSTCYYHPRYKNFSTQIKRKGNEDSMSSSRSGEKREPKYKWDYVSIKGGKFNLFKFLQFKVEQAALVPDEAHGKTIAEYVKYYREKNFSIIDPGYTEDLSNDDALGNHFKGFIVDENGYAKEYSPRADFLKDLIESNNIIIHSTKIGEGNLDEGLKDVFKKMEKEIKQHVKNAEIDKHRIKESIKENSKKELNHQNENLLSSLFNYVFKSPTPPNKDSGPNQDKDKQKNDSNNSPNYTVPLITLLIVLAASRTVLDPLFESLREGLAPVEISFQEFLDSEAFRNGWVEKVLVSSDKQSVYVYLKRNCPLFSTGVTNGVIHESKMDENGQYIEGNDISIVLSHHRKRVPRPDAPFGHFVFTIGSLESFENMLNEAQTQLLKQAEIPENKETTYKTPLIHRIPVHYEKVRSPSLIGTMLETTFSAVVSFGVLYLIIRSVGAYLMRKSGGSPFGGGGLFGGPGGLGGRNGGGNPLSNIFNVSKSKAKLYNAETAVKVTFKDVAGMEECKEEVSEFVKFLKEPKVYESLGAKIPKGAILSGPPGTGKTLLAKAIAGEAGVPFLSVSGSEFVEMFVGVGSSRVRDLFQEAKRLAPSIIFIDEIDAIGRARGRSSHGGNDERESTLNQLLVEMDGFETDQHVIVFAGTNRPDVLDPALTRPGRFDRHISIDRPDANGRRDIYLVHLKPIKLDPNGPSMMEIATKLAYMTPGFVGADIANVCNESALLAARYNSFFITEVHLEAAVEKVIAGLEKKSKVLSPEEKTIIAHHEAGHATAAWFLKYADPVMKVTIIPRTSGALGFARTLPSDDHLVSREKILDTVCVTLGGRVAEELFFGEITSGAQNDLEKVTKWIYRAITILGMDEKLGPFSFSPSQDEPLGGAKIYSEATAQLIDSQARLYLNNAYQRTKELLMEHKDKMKALARELLLKENVSRDDLERILGKRPFENKHAYDQYLLEEKMKKARPIVSEGVAVKSEASKTSEL